MSFTRAWLLFASQFLVKLAFAQSYGNITYGQTVTYGNNTYAETHLTPTAQGTTWYWSQAITPAILGTVFVVINDHNQTQTITSTNSAAVANNTQYLKNGTLSLLTRTDVNELGTVTDTVPTAGDQSRVLAYPTPYFTLVSPISWQGLFPEVQYNATCCNSLKATRSAIPQNHYSFPSMTGSTNAADPRGWLYVMAQSLQLATFSGSQNLSSLLAPATITSVRQHCPYYKCADSSTALGAEGVQMVGALLETSTVHVTGSFSNSASPAATPEQQSKETSRTSGKASVQIDPVPATRPTSMPETTKPAATAVQQVSNIVDTPHPPSPPASKTSVENVGVALGQLLDTIVPSGIDTTTASKEGATGVEAASKLLTIDSDLNIITATAPTTQLAASKVSDQLPDTTPAKTTANVGDVIASLLKPNNGNSIAKDQPSNSPEPAQIAIGSTSLGMQPTQLATTVSGISTNVPAVVIGSQTIAVGATDSMGSIPVAVVTAGSETAVVIDGSSTNFLPQASPAQEVASQPPIVIGSSTFTADSNSRYIVAGQTLAPGSSINVDGTPVALQTDGPEGSVLVVGSSSSIFQQPPTASAIPPIVIGSSTITANMDSEYVVAGQTLRPGSAITVGNTPIALQTDEPSGNVLVVGASSSTLQTLPEPTEEAAAIVIGSSTISANSASEYIVAGQTLKLGATITVGSGSSASVIALQTSDSETVLVIGSSSSTLQQQTTAVLTVGSAKITPIAGSEYLVGSQTLSPGAPAITVSGVEYSLASDGGEIVAGSSTRVLTSEAGIGGYIWSALGGSGEESSSSTSRQASTATTTDSETSSTPGSSTQPIATGAPEEDAAGSLRPAGILTLVALTVWIVHGV